MSIRLSQAVQSGLFNLPENGRIVVLGCTGPEYLQELDRETVTIATDGFVEHQRFARAGWDVTSSPEGEFGAAIIFVARARDAVRGQIATARRLTKGPIAIDGQKTDGIESLLKELRNREDAQTSAPISKAHGKLFLLEGGSFDTWVAAARDVDGFTTRAGVFSADKVDLGSALLAAALPDDLKGKVADLGAGWGYLSRQILRAEKVTSLALIEADGVALECARENVTDPRAQFHWADATSFQSAEKMDVVVTNPPFHAGRKGDPALGQAFISSAASMLAPKGVLWLVANRHLPYEQTLEAQFSEVAEIGRDTRFKIFRAARPRRQNQKRS